MVQLLIELNVFKGKYVDILNMLGVKERLSALLTEVRTSPPSTLAEVASIENRLRNLAAQIEFPARTLSDELAIEAVDYLSIMLDLPTRVRPIAFKIVLERHSSYHFPEVIFEAIPSAQRINCIDALMTFDDGRCSFEAIIESGIDSVEFPETIIRYAEQTYLSSYGVREASSDVTIHTRGHAGEEAVIADTSLREMAAHSGTRSAQVERLLPHPNRVRADNFTAIVAVLLGNSPNYTGFEPVSERFHIQAIGGRSIPYVAAMGECLDRGDLHKAIVSLLRCHLPDTRTNSEYIEWVERSSWDSVFGRAPRPPLPLTLTLNRP